MFQNLSLPNFKLFYEVKFSQSKSINNGVWLLKSSNVLQILELEVKPSNRWTFLPNMPLIQEIVPTYLKMACQANFRFLIAIIKNLSSIKVRSNIELTFKSSKVGQTWKERLLVGRNRHQAVKSHQIPFEGLYRQQFLQSSANSQSLATFPQKVRFKSNVPSNFPKSWANRIQAWLSDLNSHLPAAFVRHLLICSPLDSKACESGFQSAFGFQ